MSQKTNPYNFNYNNNLSEEDQIRACVEAGIAVFLHGLPGEGKSARVMQIDPECEIVSLGNAKIETLNGKSAYSSKNKKLISVKPTWLTNLERKCNLEKDKIHIVFFDEITNAPESVQSMAFNIVLNRNVKGRWDLPENARVVAAGNEVEDSLAASKLSEPLSVRFAHINIDTTPEEWLEWAKKKNKNQIIAPIKFKGPIKKQKIHPAILNYIFKNGDSVFKIKSEDNRTNADPRRWEMASDLLHATNNPYILKTLIGEELTQDFVAFTSKKLISVEEVINETYNKLNVANYDFNDKYMSTICLSSVSEQDVSKVRDFVRNFGGEFQRLFEKIWAGSDINRLKIINGLRVSEKNGKAK